MHRGICDTSVYRFHCVYVESLSNLKQNNFQKTKKNIICAKEPLEPNYPSISFTNLLILNRSICKATKDVFQSLLKAYIFVLNLQDDVLLGTLTVRESIMFSANVRLPADVSKEEKEAKVEKV